MVKTKKPTKPRLLKRVKPFFPWDVMTFEEVCELLRLDKKTVYRLIKMGKIPALKAGSKYRFSRQAVLEALSKYPNKPEEPKVETQNPKGSGEGEGEK